MRLVVGSRAWLHVPLQRLITSAISSSDSSTGLPSCRVSQYWLARVRYLDCHRQRASEVAAEGRPHAVAGKQAGAYTVKSRHGGVGQRLGAGK